MPLTALFYITLIVATQWILNTNNFFLLLVVVNMILINMMMAIINMAFEDIKSQTEQFKNKFEIMEYIRRSVKELSGVT